ncbi:hypothetical protein KAX17_13100 [Candidatus Bipolaricaulota bacterium]|nr:hypothetical protein [Candidatus Bipolaricaulota bacterium]
MTRAARSLLVFGIYLVLLGPNGSLRTPLGTHQACLGRESEAIGTSGEECFREYVLY